MDLTEVFEVGEMDLGDAGLELEPTRNTSQSQDSC
jgi:hypothetical protein